MLHSQPATTVLIFEKIVTNFLSAQRRETHQYASTVMIILHAVLTAIEGNVNKLLLLLKCTAFTLMEHAMMIDDSLPSKKSTFDFFSSLFRSSVFNDGAELRLGNSPTQITLRNSERFLLFLKL